jgi:hypothetical protein
MMVRAWLEREADPESFQRIAEELRQEFEKRTGTMAPMPKPGTTAAGGKIMSSHRPDPPAPKDPLARRPNPKGTWPSQRSGGGKKC